jgi:hypothetical protein
MLGCPLIDNVHSTERIATAKNKSKQGQRYSVISYILHGDKRKLQKYEVIMLKARNKKSISITGSE